MSNNKVLLIVLLVGLVGFKVIYRIKYFNKIWIAIFCTRQTTTAQTVPPTTVAVSPITGLLGVVVDVVVDALQVVNGLVQGLLGTAPTQSCGILNNGTQYYIQSTDGRFAVVDPVKQAAYMQQISSADASKFTAVQKDCNVYGFCTNGFCMSRCEGCTSDSGDFETVSFHETTSDFQYDQWNLTSVGEQYNLQVVDIKYYLTIKSTSNGDQLTLLTNPDANSAFSLNAVN